MATAQTICYRSDSYRNWVRGSVGLGYLQEGLQAFAETTVQTEHRNILQRIGNCGKCSIESILPAHAKQGYCIQKDRRRCNCTKKGKSNCTVCSKMYDEIIIQHRYNDPNWEIDSAGLFSDHWQFAKCFMTTTKKESNNTAAETDAACLLSIIINGNFFQTELDTIIDGENDIFSQAKKVRNAILHRSKLELTEDEVTGYLKIMIDVLQDKKVLNNDEAAQTAVTKITYIMNTKFVITTEIEESAIESAQRSIKGAGELWENVLKELTLHSQEIIGGKTSQSLAEISQAKENAIQDIIGIRQVHHQDIPVQDQATHCEEEVLRENAMILNKIAEACAKKKIKHTDNILLIGTAGSGKSALINTISKALSGKYIPRARCGDGKTEALTTTFEWFENCGITKDDIADADRRDILKDVIPYLPSLVDSPPFGDANVQDHKEVLELVIGGYIPPDTSVQSLCKLQRENCPDFLKVKFAESNPEWRISKIVFVESCRSGLPRNLIAMVNDLLQKVDKEGIWLKYSIDVFVAITRYDLVHVYSNTAEDGISLENFEHVEDAICQEFNINDMKEHSMIRWASYCDTIGYDNPYVDNIALKFVQLMLEKNSKPSKPYHFPTLSIRKWFQIKLRNLVWRWNRMGFELNPEIFGLCLYQVLVGIYSISRI